MSVSAGPRLTVVIALASSAAALKVASRAPPTVKLVPPALASPRIDTLVEELRPVLKPASDPPSAHVLWSLNAELQHTAEGHTRRHAAPPPVGRDVADAAAAGGRLAVD